MKDLQTTTVATVQSGPQGDLNAVGNGSDLPSAAAPDQGASAAKPEEQKPTVADSVTLGKIMTGEKPVVESGPGGDKTTSTDTKHTPIPYKVDGKEFVAKDDEIERLLSAGHKVDARLREVAEKEKGLDAFVTQKVDEATWAHKELSDAVKTNPDFGVILDKLHINRNLVPKVKEFIDGLFAKDSSLASVEEANAAKLELARRNSADDKAAREVEYQSGYKEGESMLTQVKKDLGVDAIPPEYAKQIGELLDSGEADSILKAHQILDLKSGARDARVAKAAETKLLEELKGRQSSVGSKQGFQAGRSGVVAAEAKHADVATVGAIMRGDRP